MCHWYHWVLVSDTICDPEIQLSGYNVFRNDRCGSWGGGVPLYIHKSLMCTPSEKLKAVGMDESLWYLVSLSKNTTLLIRLIYRSPTSVESNNSKLLEIFQIISQQYGHTQLLLMGDFNFPDINWVDSSSFTSLSAKFLDVIQDSFLTQHVEEPTRHQPDQQSSVLDLIITHDPNSITNVFHLPPLGSSDHKCLKWQFFCNTNHKNAIQIKTYNYYQGDYDSFNNYLKGIDWSAKLENHNINYNYNIFVQTLSSLLDTFILKTKKIDKSRPPWWSKKLTKAVTHKSTLFTKWKNTKTNANYQAYAKQRNIVKTMIRSARSNYEKNLIQQFQSYPKLLYCYLRSKKNQTQYHSTTEVWRLHDNIRYWICLQIK